MLGSIGREALTALGDPFPPAVIGPPRGSSPWASRLPVDALATDAVGLASAAINAASAARRGAGDVLPVSVDRRRIAASFASERLFRIDGQQPDTWAPLSGFSPAADGWVRTHANYPHHAAALKAALGLADDADTARVKRAIADISAADLEERAAAFGAVVGKVRSPAEWRSHPHGSGVAERHLIERRRVAGAEPRPWLTGAGASADGASRVAPLAGIRVLDLTRVIAGPIASRDLALAGADVVRVDSPRLPELGWIHLDTGQGKRSTLLDLRRDEDRSQFGALLATADVVLLGYRPGALSRFALDADALVAHHPGLVVGSISAWGETGPWRSRRGFDSIVQAVSGVSAVEAADDAVAPGALPVQALDHATGHLLAAAVVLALIEQRRDGGGHVVGASLARTAHALLHSTDSPAPPEPSGDLPSRGRRVADGRRIIYAPPVLAFEGAPEDYPRVGARWGADDPEWLSRADQP